MQAETYVTFERKSFCSSYSNHLACNAGLQIWICEYNSQR